MTSRLLPRPPALFLLHLRPFRFLRRLRSQTLSSRWLSVGRDTRRHVLFVSGAHASSYDRSRRDLLDPGADLFTELRIAVRAIGLERAERRGVLPWLQDERGVRIGPVERAFGRHRHDDVASRQ